MLVDDQRLVRSGFAMGVGSKQDMHVVAEAADGMEAVEALGRTQADVVLMDVRMPRPGRRRSDAPDRRSRPGGQKIIVLTTFDLDEYAFAALQASTSGVPAQGRAPPRSCCAPIRTVHAGDAVVAPSTTQRLIARYVRRGTAAELPSAGVESLTEREREVWLAIARGLTNGEIAASLGISEATVKTHVGNVLGKTGMRDRVALVVLAYECGVVGSD